MLNRSWKSRRFFFAIGCTSLVCATLTVQISRAVEQPDMSKQMPMAMQSKAIKQVADGVCVMPDKVPAAADKYYEITVQNQTRGQFLSPPLFVTHEPGMKLWTEGEQAMPGVVQLCETGLNANLAVALRMKPTTDVVTCPLPVMPGEMAKIVIRAKDGDVISALAMLAVTNDGFTGLSGAPLTAGETQALAYDVGHEENNEREAFIPAKLGTQSELSKPQDAIRTHPGIQGGHDLDKMKDGWDGPVATFTIRPIEAPMADGMTKK